MTERIRRRQAAGTRRLMQDKEPWEHATRWDIESVKDGAAWPVAASAWPCGPVGGPATGLIFGDFSAWGMSHGWDQLPRAISKPFVVSKIRMKTGACFLLTHLKVGVSVAH